MPNTKALMKLLEQRATVNEVPGLYEKSGKAIDIPRPGKNIEAAPGPTSRTKTIQPTNPTANIDPRINKLSEEDLLALLARSISEFEEQKIGSMSPMLTGKHEFRESGVPRSDRFIEDQLLTDNLAVMDNDVTQSVTGPGHVNVNDPLADPVQSLIDFVQENKRGNNPAAIAEYMRGRNSTADFQQGSNIARSTLAGKGGLDPFDFETDYIDPKEFTRLNDQYKGDIARVGSATAASPSMRKASNIGPSSTNAAAERGLNVQSARLLTPDKLSPALADMLDALELSRSPPSGSMADTGNRLRRFAPTERPMEFDSGDPISVIHSLEQRRPIQFDRPQTRTRTTPDILDNPQYQEQLLKLMEAKQVLQRIKSGELTAGRASTDVTRKLIGQQQQKLVALRDRLVLYRELFDQLEKP